MTDARRVLLGGLIDYAGLFPPAALDVAGAVAGFRATTAHAHGWLVDRFVAGAAVIERVGEARLTTLDPDDDAGGRALDRSVGGDVCDAGTEPWRVALVVAAPELRAAAEAAGRVLAALRVTAVELRPLPAGEVRGALEAARAVFPEATLHAEVAPGDLRALDAVAEAGGRAKLRLGGEAVPDPEDVAATLRGCAERGVALKGTAGLHHAVAAEARHGFLNLLAAAALDGDLDALSDHDPGAFRLDAGGFSWRGQPLDPAAARARFTGFGSCSFDEPVDDLVALGALEPAEARA